MIVQATANEVPWPAAPWKQGADGEQQRRSTHEREQAAEADVDRDPAHLGGRSQG